MPAIFDQMDVHGLDTSLAFFAVDTTVTPMRRLTLDTPAALDPDRQILALKGIRSEWHQRVDLGDNGPGSRSSGEFRASVAGMRLRVTLKLADLPFPVKLGDEITYSDRPGKKYVVSELLPEDAMAITLALNEA